MKCAIRRQWPFVVLICLALHPALLQAQFRSLTPIYRFWSPVTSRHFYTIDAAERDKLMNEYADLWTYEGVAYYAYARDSEPGLMPVFRFWSPVTSGHFYTIDAAERDKLVDEYAGVWTFEGTAFYAYPPDGQPAQADAVYRFWSPVTSGHFYTIDEAERDKLLNEYADVWVPEDVAWYAYTDPNVVEPTPPALGVYEFTGGAESVTCTFTLKAYLNGVEATIDDPGLTFIAKNPYMRMAVDFDAMTTTMEEVLVETEIADHRTTIRAGTPGQVTIPMTLSSSVIFWATTPRGPFGINPQNLRFPIISKTMAGENETFTLTGSIVLLGSKFNVGQAVRATRFAEGKGEFGDAALPANLDVSMVQPFQWVRSQHEDRLIQATVGGNQVQLYITSAQVRTTGAWQGTPEQ